MRGEKINFSSLFMLSTILRSKSIKLCSINISFSIASQKPKLNPRHKSEIAHLHSLYKYFRRSPLLLICGQKDRDDVMAVGRL